VRIGGRSRPASLNRDGERVLARYGGSNTVTYEFAPVERVRWATPESRCSGSVTKMCTCARVSRDILLVAKRRRTVRCDADQCVRMQGGLASGAPASRRVTEIWRDGDRAVGSGRSTFRETSSEQGSRWVALVVRGPRRGFVVAKGSWTWNVVVESEKGRMTLRRPIKSVRVGRSRAAKFRGKVSVGAQRIAGVWKTMSKGAQDRPNW